MIFQNSLLLDAFLRYFTSVLVFLYAFFKISYMASYSFLWFILGSVVVVWLMDDIVFKKEYFERQLHFRFERETYPHILEQLAELYPNNIVLGNDNIDVLFIHADA
jgi:hypothetical protein